MNPRYTVYADDGFVFATEDGTVVLCFQSECSQGDAVALANMLELARRDGFRQAQEMLDKSITV